MSIIYNTFIFTQFHLGLFSQEFLNGTTEAYDNMLMGLASTLSEREDHIVVPDLRSECYKT